ncbi:MAG TPA: hypothetical protein VG323_15475 [Thermoanaerobaculia bacterium]|nr:hypothetical protein [Thermoanaerobaculia bacterium]
MKKSCSTWSVIYFVAALFVGHLVYRRFPMTVAVLAGGAIGGGIVWLGLAYLVGVWTKLAEARRMSRAGEGGPPRDGETIAVAGTIEPVGAPLTSPVSGKPCVAYKYEVRRDDDLLYDGFALAPCAIDSPHGRIRIFAWPDLQTEARAVPNASDRFDSYVEETKFREPTLSLHGALAPFNDRDGSVRVDTRMTPHKPDLVTAEFTERSFAPGDRVVATGRYSTERGGLVAEPGMPLSVSIRDAARSGAGRSVAGAVGNLIGGVIFLAIAAAGVLALYVFVPLSASEQMSPNSRRTWHEVRLDRTIERRLRVPLRKAGIVDEGIPTAMLDAGVARGRVTANGRDVDVSRATAERAGDAFVIHIDDDVAVLTVDKGEHPLRLRLGGDEIDPSTFARDLEVQITSSTHHGEIAGRFTYFRDDAESPAARVTFHARF